jgi:hypothetical protein
MNIGTLVPYIYQCVERSIKVFYTFFFSATSSSPFQSHRIQGNICHTDVKNFTWKKLSNVNRKHFFMNMLCIESLCPQETQNRTLLFGSIRFRHSRLLDCWYQTLNWSLRVCYLDLHEVGLWCYTYRETNSSIAAVLLPFVTNLLTIPHTYRSCNCQVNMLRTAMHTHTNLWISLQIQNSLCSSCSYLRLWELKNFQSWDDLKWHVS